MRWDSREEIHGTEGGGPARVLWRFRWESEPWVVAERVRSRRTPGGRQGRARRI